MNLIKLQDQLKGMPDNYLTQMVQQPTGAIPQFLVLGEIQRRKDMRDSAQQAPETSVAEDLATEGEVPDQVEQGIAALPTEMEEAPAMAGGGIIAFARGGKTYMPLSRAEYDRLIPSEKQAYVDQYGAPPAEREATVNPLGLDTRKSPLMKALQEGTPLRPSTPPAAAPVTPPAAGNALPSFSEFMQQNKNPLAAEATRDQVAPPPIMDNKPPRLPMPKAVDETAKLLDFTAPTIAYNREGYKEAMLPTRDAAAEAARFKSIVGEDTGLAGLKDKLAAMEEKSKGEEERAPWMALVRAGLGMAAGTSPYALSNIGAGGIEGLKDYQATRDRLDKAEEKRFDTQARIAQAERAEQVAAAKFGTESEQYADTQNRLAKLHALDAENTAKIHDASNALTAQKNAIEVQQLRITEKHYDDWYRVSLKTAEKSLQGIEKQGIQQQTQILNNLLDEANAQIKNVAADMNATAQDRVNAQAKYDAIQQRLMSITGVPYTPKQSAPASKLTPASKGSGADYRFGF